MKDILLVCKEGISAELIRKRLIQRLKCIDETLQIKSCGIYELNDLIDQQLIVLAPQIRYYEEDIKVKYPQHTVVVLEMDDYATMNLEAIERIMLNK